MGGWSMAAAMADGKKQKPMSLAAGEQISTTLLAADGEAGLDFIGLSCMSHHTLIGQDNR